MKVLFLLICFFFASEAHHGASKKRSFLKHKSQTKSRRLARQRYASQKTKWRKKRAEKKARSASKYVKFRKRILSRKAKREKLFKKNEDRRRRQWEKRLKQAQRRADSRRKKKRVTGIDPNEEFGINMPPIIYKGKTYN